MVRIEKKKITVGRQFTRREHEAVVDQNGNELGTLITLHSRDYFGKASIEKQISVSREVLGAAGIDVDRLLMDAPHGSRVREHVIAVLAKDFDTIEGLASIVLEKALHCKELLSRRPVHAPTLAAYAYSLARYGTLLEVYISHIGQRKKTASVPRAKHPVPAALKDAFKKQRRQARTLQEALTALRDESGSLRIVDGNNPLEYLVSLDGQDGELHEKTYKLKTLENLWAKSQI